MVAPLTILGIMVADRAEKAPEVQETITKFGSEIIGRMGVPGLHKEQGLITLVMEADLEKVAQFRQALSEIPGTQVQTMSFAH